MYQAIALIVGGMATSFCVIHIAGASVLVLMPKQALSRLLPAGGSLAISVLLGCMSFRTAFGTPTEITVDGDGRVEFRSRLRTIVLEASNITSITTGEWYDPNRFHAVVRHKGGRLTLVNDFADFEDLLATLRDLNPAIQIKGF
jgi:hypothetical protein